MLARGTTLSRVAFAPRIQVRGMATEQQLRGRIQAVKNIKKITAAMKMVAASKLRGAQNVLEKARAFQRSMDDLAFKPKDPKAFVAKDHLFMGLTSDRGLCGAINSSIVRAMRDSVNKEKAETPDVGVKIIVIGEKGKQGLERLFKESFVTTLSEAAKFKAISFRQCGVFTDEWLGVDAAVSSVFYQRFKSMIAYETTEHKYYNYNLIKDELVNSMAEYEMEGDPDILQNLNEFRCAVKLYYYFAETETSTLSARMTAMDNSANNASDMIDSLNLLMNRNRQAKITTELSEIISGAAAVDDA